MSEQKMSTIFKYLYRMGKLSSLLALLCIAIVWLGNFSAPDIMFSVLMMCLLVLLYIAIISLGMLAISVVIYSVKIKNTKYFVKYSFLCILFLIFIIEILIKLTK
ncbi:hypothetical protein [Streptococcus marimammalium]|uniref:hypothetical protein n=1 Tax=Streptococcus marimammalium TaxID=269666 RepID=UPI00036F9A94|nr:hypothetical protein [Streptococcus marimammalium]